MLNMKEISDEIAGLEAGDTNWASMQRLAWLYTVRDHLTSETKGSRPVFNATAGHVNEIVSNSEFLTACSGVDIPELLQVLNEHMDAIKVVHNKEYSVLIRRINSLHHTH